MKDFINIYYRNANKRAEREYEAYRVDDYSKTGMEILRAVHENWATDSEMAVKIMESL